MAGVARSSSASRDSRTRSEGRRPGWRERTNGLALVRANTVRIQGRRVMEISSGRVRLRYHSFSGSGAQTDRPGAVVCWASADTLVDGTDARNASTDAPRTVRATCDLPGKPAVQPDAAPRRFLSSGLSDHTALAFELHGRDVVTG